MRAITLIITAALLGAASTAQAHVTLAEPEATVGASYRATFRVPHGCGTSPTVKVRVRIPVGVVGVKPMPKSGWKLDLVRGKYDKPYNMYHSTLTEGVKEVAWSSGNLPNDYYDEFVLSVYLTADLVPGTTLYFPVVQECEDGVNRWIEIPAEGKSSSDYKQPAPALRLRSKK